MLCSAGASVAVSILPDTVTEGVSNGAASNTFTIISTGAPLPQLLEAVTLRVSVPFAVQFTVADVPLGVNVPTPDNCHE